LQFYVASAGCGGFRPGAGRMREQSAHAPLDSVHAQHSLEFEFQFQLDPKFEFRFESEPEPTKESGPKSKRRLFLWQLPIEFLRSRSIFRWLSGHAGRVHEFRHRGQRGRSGSKRERRFGRAGEHKHSGN
jgi:hypothetical protein